jgi:hypothetical protein
MKGDGSGGVPAASCLVQLFQHMFESASTAATSFIVAASGPKYRHWLSGPSFVIWVSICALKHPPQSPVPQCHRPIRGPHSHVVLKLSSPLLLRVCASPIVHDPHSFLSSRVFRSLCFHLSLAHRLNSVFHRLPLVGMATTIAHYSLAILALILCLHLNSADALSVRSVDLSPRHGNTLERRDLTIPTPPAGWKSLGCYTYVQSSQIEFWKVADLWK